MNEFYSGVAMFADIPTRWLFLVSAIALLLVAELPTSLAETLQQRQALYDFYRSTTNWSTSCSGGWRALGNESGGGPPSTFCNSPAPFAYSTFYGVTCDSVNGMITMIVLNSCGIAGTARCVCGTDLTVVSVPLTQRVHGNRSIFLGDGDGRSSTASTPTKSSHRAVAGGVCVHDAVVVAEPV